jgi:hypothetical protein
VARGRLEPHEQVEGRQCIPISHVSLENLPFERRAPSMHPAHTKSKEPSMHIELRSGAVRLAPNQTLKLIDGAGSTVCAVAGSVWITEENQPRDIVLKAGACYRLRERGVALVNSLGGFAAVSLA